MRYLTLALLGVVAAVALVACPPHNTPQPVPPSDPGAGYDPPPPVDAGPRTSEPPDAEVVASGAGVAGASCSLDADCASGTCEGPGCGEGEGVCAPDTRGCTKDLRTYCGCDGVEFKASGSCPGARYATSGSCAP